MAAMYGIETRGYARGQDLATKWSRLQVELDLVDD
jgi:hypothetical protein